MNKRNAAVQPVYTTPLIWILLLAAPLAGCTREERGVKVAMKQIVDASGLVLEIPDGYFVEERSDGLVISPPVPKDLRIPPEVVVTAHRGSPGDQERRVDARRVGNQLVSYRIEHEPAESLPGEGSGYRFTAWLAWKGLTIEVRQDERNPRADTPDFELAWKVIEGIGRQSQAHIARADDV